MKVLVVPDRCEYALCTERYTHVISGVRKRSGKTSWMLRVCDRHLEAYREWETTRHARRTVSLVYSPRTDGVPA